MRPLSGRDGFGDFPQGQIHLAEGEIGWISFCEMSSAFGPSSRASSYLPALNKWAISTPRKLTFRGSCSTARRICTVDSSKRPKGCRYRKSRGASANRLGGTP